MSERPKQPYQGMKYCADMLVSLLSPACSRIELAGSLRRMRPMISDIEIIAIPKPITNLIGEPTGRTEVDDLLDRFPVHFVKRGQRYQQFWFEDRQKIQPFYVDLFLQNADTWGVNMMIRTGSAEFSKRMVTPKPQGGYMPPGYTIREARVWTNGATVATPEEADIFDFWGMKFVQPVDRQ